MHCAVCSYRYTVEIGSDVWQMGMFIFAGLLARFPWEKADITDPRFSEFVQWQKRKITRTPKDFRRFTPRLHRMLRRLMDPKPSKRYEIKEASEKGFNIFIVNVKGMLCFLNGSRQDVRFYLLQICQ